MDRRGVSNIAVKRLNLKAVFAHLMRHGPSSVRDISSALGMSAPTVIQNLAELTDRKLAVVSGMQSSTGGRKARAYGVNESARYAAGLDITRNDVSLVVLNLCGERVDGSKLRLPFYDKEDYYRAVGKLVHARLEQAGIAPGDLVGVGISLPAIISSDGERTTNADPLGKRIIHLDSFLKHLAWPCRLVNDANAGGYAEFWADPADAGAKPANLVYLSVSNTVGGSALIGGRMFDGDDQHSAEFGHMTLMPDGKTCYCGQKGCAYCYVNTRILSDACGSLESFFEQLAAGDARARALWDEYSRYLALLINNIRNAYDCRVIVGGYLGRFLGPHLEELRAQAAARNIFERSGAYIRACAHVSEGAALGAALIVLHGYIGDV
jgi:predicted NBD/HSP70 family sugar kinase